MYGCNNYYAASNETQAVHSFGTFYLPLCSNHTPHPVTAPLFFISFVIICSFILISLTVASVTYGINGRFHELVERGENGDDVKGINGIARIITSTQLSLEQQQSLVANQALLVMLMKQIWEDTDYGNLIIMRQRTKFFTRNGFVSNLKFNWSTAMLYWDINIISVAARKLSNQMFYHFLFGILIISSVTLEILEIEKEKPSDALFESLKIIFQVMFTLDLAILFLSRYPNIFSYFNKIGNCLYAFVVLVSWMTVIESIVVLCPYFGEICLLSFK